MKLRMTTFMRSNIQIRIILKNIFWHLMLFFHLIIYKQPLISYHSRKSSLFHVFLACRSTFRSRLDVRYDFQSNTA